MIKPITSKSFYSIVAATALSGLVAANSVQARPIPNKQSDSKELIQKNTANALKVKILVTTPLYSNEHNPNLTKKVQEATPSGMSDIIGSMVNESYKDLGTFNTSIWIQNVYDKDCFDKMLDECEKVLKENTPKGIADFEYAKNFIKMNKEDYDASISAFYDEHFSKKRSAQNSHKLLDNLAKELFADDKESFEIYQKEVDAFKAQQRNPNTVISQADQLTHKIFLLDAYAYKIFFDLIYELQADEYQEIFKKHFLDKAKPTP